MATRHRPTELDEEEARKRSRALDGTATRCATLGAESDAEESMRDAAENLTRMVAFNHDAEQRSNDGEASEADCEGRVSKGEKAEDKPAPFLRKLALMLQSSEFTHLVRWEGAAADDPDGSQTFVVLDACTFSKELLPRFFKHNKLSSFVQQLYTYGFRRVDAAEVPKPALGAEMGTEAPKWLTFEHDVFRPSAPRALQHIKRRLKGPSRTVAASSSSASTVDDDELELEHAALLQEEMAALETQLMSMIRTHTQKQQFDLQRLDGIWRLTQARLLHQSHWWTSVAAANAAGLGSGPGPTATAAMLEDPQFAWNAGSAMPSAMPRVEQRVNSRAQMRVPLQQQQQLPPSPGNVHAFPGTSSAFELASQLASLAGAQGPLSLPGMGMPGLMVPPPPQPTMPRVAPQLLAALVAQAAQPLDTPPPPSLAAAAAMASIAESSGNASSDRRRRHSRTDLASVSLASMATYEATHEAAYEAARGASTPRAATDRGSNPTCSTAGGSNAEVRSQHSTSMGRDTSPSGVGHSSNEGSGDGSAQGSGDGSNEGSEGSEDGGGDSRAATRIENDSISEEAAEAAAAAVALRGAGLRVFGSQGLSRPEGSDSIDL